MFETLTGWRDGPRLHLHVKDIDSSESLCGSRLRCHSSDFNEHEHFFKKEEEEGEEVCLLDRQLSFCRGAARQCMETVVSPRTCKNNCFHVPDNLAGPSEGEGGRWRAKGGRGELVKGNPREGIREQCTPS